ncbi:MAG: hypothetical protein CFE35_21315 [Novosphingobium sp. PASSN1]|nr:MAG: hypothetical protein CFE35_21315 [Novosphingobium sp. PASSN1]
MAWCGADAWWHDIALILRGFVKVGRFPKDADDFVGGAMSIAEKWDEVLIHSNKINALNESFSQILVQLSEIIRDAEEAFGEDSEEMGMIHDSVLDLRHSKFDDLLHFAEMITEKRDFKDLQLFH